MGKLRHGSSGKRSQALPAGWWQSWDVSLPPEVALGPCSYLCLGLSSLLSLPVLSLNWWLHLVSSPPPPQVDILLAQSPASSLCPHLRHNLYVNGSASVPLPRLRFGMPSLKTSSVSPPLSVTLLPKLILKCDSLCTPVLSLTLMLSASEVLSSGYFRFFIFLFLGPPQ